MSPGLFHNFMDLYMKFYNFSIISLTKDSQSGGLSINGFPIRVNPSRNPMGS